MDTRTIWAERVAITNVTRRPLGKRGRGARRDLPRRRRPDPSHENDETDHRPARLPPDVMASPLWADLPTVKNDQEVIVNRDLWGGCRRYRDASVVDPERTWLRPAASCDLEMSPTAGLVTRFCGAASGPISSGRLIDGTVILCGDVRWVARVRRRTRVSRAGPRLRSTRIQDDIWPSTGESDGSPNDSDRSPTP